MLSENHTKCIEFYSDYGIKSTFVLYSTTKLESSMHLLIIGRTNISIQK